VGVYEDAAADARRGQEEREALEVRVRRRLSQHVAAHDDEFQQEGREVARALRGARVAPTRFGESVFSTPGWPLVVVASQYADDPPTVWNLHYRGFWLNWSKPLSLALASHLRHMDWLDETGEVKADVEIPTNYPRLTVSGGGLYVSGEPLRTALALAVRRAVEGSRRKR
jgi:hypothetical protein